MSESEEQLRQRAVSGLQRGDFAAAVRSYRHLLAGYSGQPDDWYNLAWSLRRTGSFEEALAAYDEALNRGIDQPEEVHLNRAAILSTHLNRDEEARVALEAALACNDRYCPARLNLGNLLEEAGQRDQALACYRRLQSDLPEADPIRLEALARVFHLDPVRSSQDARLLELESAAARRDLDPKLQANLLLALARSQDRLGLYDRAFAAMRAGKNAAAATAPAYDPARQERLIDALIDTFPGSAESGVAADHDGPSLVFICGMYRSGSTLVERILGAHSRVVPGGELDLLPHLVAEHLQPFPKAAVKLDSSAAAGLADAYVDGLRRQLPSFAEHRVVTDKRPANFLLIGLMLRLFPNARIIHTVRNPLDTALSIYMQHLEPRIAPYAGDLGDIAHYYLQYRRLMTHWQSAFPGRILDVDYDALVSDPVPAVRSALEFIGLEWESACMDFHLSRSAVRTASYWQVRQPLYRHASGRWRHYRRYLEELRRRLIAGGVEDSELDRGR